MIRTRPRRERRRLRRADLLAPLAALLVAGLAACTGPSGGHLPDGTDLSPEQTSPDAARDAPWPAPDPARPVVDLSFTLPETLDRATGTERVVFTPDQQVCDVVFRAWPNSPYSAEAGSALTVDRLFVDGRALTPQVEAAGAPDGAPGTLISARLPQCSPGGRALTIDLGFSVRLGEAPDDRLGHSPDRRVAWLGTAFPLLAWERGRGWDRTPAVRVVGESTTSETFRLRRLDVTAPRGLRVAGLGTPGGTSDDTAAGTTRHRFSADAVRDVTLTVGDLDITERTVGGTTVRVARAQGAAAGAQEWLEESERLLRDLSGQLGPIPYPDVWISVLPHVTDGVEYPGAVQMSDIDPRGERWLLTHELAHQWFYGLVGNNAGRHPWLDESTATYAQERVDPTALSGEDPHEWLGLDGQVGRPMTWWAQQRRPDREYVATVYRGGGRALLQAREAAGGDAFDAAIRGYLRANAHTIAEPADLADALADLPAATDVLRSAGALTD